MKIRSTLRRNFPTLCNFQLRLRFYKHLCSRAFWHFSVEKHSKIPCIWENFMPQID